MQNFFSWNHRRKEFSATNSNETGDELKKQKEGSKNESSASTLDDAFPEGLKNPDCVLVLAHCLRTLEQQVKEMFDLAKKSNESEIKGELALQEVNKAISFSSEKFDACEQERRRNDKKCRIKWNSVQNERRNWRARKQDWSSGIASQTKLYIDTWDCWE